MFFLDSFLMEQLDGEENTYVPVSEIVGETQLQQLLKMVKKEHPKVTDEQMKNLQDFIDALHMKILNGEERKDMEDTEIPNIQSLDDIDEEIQKKWGEIEHRVIDMVLEENVDEFPMFVDIFRVGGFLFALEVENKMENLEDAMEVYVEQENYERAAEIRDALKEMGSDEVVS